MRGRQEEQEDADTGQNKQVYARVRVRNLATATVRTRGARGALAREDLGMCLTQGSSHSCCTILSLLQGALTSERLSQHLQILSGRPSSSHSMVERSLDLRNHRSSDPR